MIVSFAYPTSPMYSGGVAALFEFAGALARRGHEVHFIHGPAILADSIRDVAEITWFDFHPSIVHHVADDLTDEQLPAADVIFVSDAPARLGLPAALIQGHGMVPEEWERAVFRARCPKFCVAGWLVEVGISYGAPPEQMLHLPLGLDHDLFHPPAAPAERAIDVAMLYGAAHPAKGWTVGLRALEAVRADRPDLQVSVFSVPQPQEPLPPWITFVHDPPRRRLAEEIYGRTKVFLQSSHYEGFGFTAVEAMACGAALVTTDNGGSRDYAIHGETALVVAPGDVGGLAQAVETLLDDATRRAELARAGSQLVRRFDWQRSGELLESHLLRYLADPDALRGPPGPERRSGTGDPGAADGDQPSC